MHSGMADPEVECPLLIKTITSWGPGLAQSVEHGTLDLEVTGASPTLDIELALKKKKRERVTSFLKPF